MVAVVQTVLKGVIAMRAIQQSVLFADLRHTVTNRVHSLVQVVEEYIQQLNLQTMTEIMSDMAVQFVWI